MVSKKILGSVLALALVGGAVGLVMAQQPAGPGPGMRGRTQRMGEFDGQGPMGAMWALNRLDLSDTQRADIKAVMERHHAKIREQAEATRKAFEALQDAVTADEFDEALIRQRSAELAKFQADDAVMRAQIGKEVFALLTPDQQAQARKLRADMKQRFEERRQRFEQRRQRPQ